MDLQTSPDHCGTIGNACPDACQAGVCVGDCTAPNLDNCNDACVNRDTDPRNCGDCGQACDADEVCIGGNCRRYRVGVTHYRGPASGVRGTLTVLENAGTPAETRRHIPFRLGAPDPSDLTSLAVLSP